MRYRGLASVLLVGLACCTGGRVPPRGIQFLGMVDRLLKHGDLSDVDYVAQTLGTKLSRADSPPSLVQPGRQAQCFVNGHLVTQAIGQLRDDAEYVPAQGSWLFSLPGGQGNFTFLVLQPSPADDCHPEVKYKGHAQLVVGDAQERSCATPVDARRLFPTMTRVTVISGPMIYLVVAGGKNESHLEAELYFEGGPDSFAHCLTNVQLDQDIFQNHADSLRAAFMAS